MLSQRTLATAALMIAALLVGRSAMASDVTLSLGEGVMVGQNIEFPVTASFVPTVPGTEIIGFNLDVAGSGGITAGTTDLDGPSDDDFSRFSFTLSPELTALGWGIAANFNEPLAPSLAEIIDNFTGGVTDSTIPVGKIVADKAGLTPGAYAVRIDGPQTTVDLLVPDALQGPPTFTRQTPNFEVADREFIIDPSNVIPEPASLALLSGFALLSLRRRALRS